MTRPNVSSPYLDFDRRAWSGLRNSFPQVLTEDDLEKIRGIGESIDLAEVADVYLPLSRLIHLQIQARQELTATTETFLGENPQHVPFVIGVAGSVAVGKSTTPLAGVIAAVAQPSACGFSHNRWVFVPRRAAAEAGAHEPEGVSGKLRSAGIIAVCDGCEIGQAECAGAGVFAHALRPGAERVYYGEPAGHSHR